MQDGEDDVNGDTLLFAKQAFGRGLEQMGTGRIRYDLDLLQRPEVQFLERLDVSQRIPCVPPAVFADVDGHDIIFAGLQGAHDLLGRNDRDLVFHRAAAKDNCNSFVHYNASFPNSFECVSFRL